MSHTTITSQGKTKSSSFRPKNEAKQSENKLAVIIICIALAVLFVFLMQ